MSWACLALTNPECQLLSSDQEGSAMYNINPCPGSLCFGCDHYALQRMTVKICNALLPQPARQYLFSDIVRKLAKELPVKRIGIR